MARPLPTLGPAQARLSKSLADLQLTRTEAENALEVTSRDLANLEEHERELRKEVERVEGKREWVEEFRGWVELLGSFLEEKVCTHIGRKGYWLILFSSQSWKRSKRMLPIT